MAYAHIVATVGRSTEAEAVLWRGVRVVIHDGVQLPGDWMSAASECMKYAQTTVGLQYERESRRSERGHVSNAEL